MELEVQGIKKSYGKKNVLKNINLKAKSGECTGIIGANGCGKSTLLRIIAGVERAEAGEILIDGKLVKRSSAQLRELVGYIPQESVLMPELSVADNLKLWAALGDYRKNRENLERLCRKFQIYEFYKEKVKNLSGGMCKRVNIVCGLIHGPSILLMDEPSAALDLVFKEELKGYIRDFIQSGGSVLLCSHEEGEFRLCQSLWAVHEGQARLIPEGMTMEEIFNGQMDIIQTGN